MDQLWLGKISNLARFWVLVPSCPKHPCFFVFWVSSFLFSLVFFLFFFLRSCSLLLPLVSDYAGFFGIRCEVRQTGLSGNALKTNNVGDLLHASPSLLEDKRQVCAFSQSWRSMLASGTLLLLFLGSYLFKASIQWWFLQHSMCGRAKTSPLGCIVKGGEGGQCSTPPSHHIQL